MDKITGNKEEQMTATTPNYDVKKFEGIARPRSEEARKRVQWLRENRKWLKMSQEIAMGIQYYLRVNKMTQKELAERMNVSPAYIGKVLRGEENLTLETICKIQDSLQYSLVNVAIPYIIRESLSIAPTIKESVEVNKSDTYSCKIDSTQKYSSALINLVS